VQLFRQLAREEQAKVEATLGAEALVGRKFGQAAQILDEIITDHDFVEFLTLPAYKYLD
jgi:malate synthase